MAKRSPKSIGTHGETAVLKIALRYWPTARREVLHGHSDLGDIVGCGPVMLEVKAGAQTRQFGDVVLDGWLAETERERKNLGVRWGILVVQRAGFGEGRAERWWAYLNAAALADIMGAPGHTASAPVRLEYGHLLDLLADQGHTVDTPSDAVA